MHLPDPMRRDQNTPDHLNADIHQMIVSRNIAPSVAVNAQFPHNYYPYPSLRLQPAQFAEPVAKRSPNVEPIEPDSMANKSPHREDPMQPLQIA
jgi:hypothetical protein